MFVFDSPKHLLSRDQIMVLKLSMKHPDLLDYFEHSYRDYTDPSGVFYRKNHTFLGFLEETLEVPIGFTHQGQRFVAVHMFEQNWDYNSPVKIDEITGNVVPDEFIWFLTFQGDSIAYYLRFACKTSLEYFWQQFNVMDSTHGMMVKSAY